MKWLCQTHRMVGTYLLKIQKSEMLSLPDDGGWAPIIAARVFTSLPPIQIQFCKIVSWCPLLQGVDTPSLVMYSFHFMPTFNIVTYP